MSKKKQPMIADSNKAFLGKIPVVEYRKDFTILTLKLLPAKSENLAIIN